MRLLAAGLRWLHSATRVPARSAPRLFRAAAASFARPLPVVLSVAGALGLGLSVLALTPGSPGRVPHSVVGASLQPVTLGSAEAAHAYDSVPPGTVDGDGAAGPEGAIAEAEQVLAAPADAVSSSASRFGMPLTAWYAVTDRYGAPRGPGIVHGGIDLDVRGYSRSPIYAACDGVVASTGYSSSYGYHAIVDCGDGWATLYGHMSTILASPGESVARGESVVGRTGNSGFSTGEHLHFEIHHQGARVNPESYLDFKIPPGTPLSSGPPVYTVRVAPGGGAAAASGSSGQDGAVPTSSPRAPEPTNTPPPTATPAATPTLVPIPPHGSGLGECPRTSSGAVNCGLAPYPVVCAPTGWFLDYGADFANPRGWPVSYAGSALEAGGACG